jgi:hypothetical protein
VDQRVEVRQEKPRDIQTRRHAILIQLGLLHYSTTLATMIRFVTPLLFTRCLPKHYSYSGWTLSLT